MDILNQISYIPLFKDLPEDQRRQLASIVRERRFTRSQKIFSEGDPGTGFYVVISGQVKIYKSSIEGREQILHFFGPGELFGEVPVFEGKNFPASAEAMEDSKVFYFNRDSMISLLKKNPAIAMNLLSVLSRRLRRFATLIDDLSLKEVPARLAAYLLYMSDQKRGSMDFELRMKKKQLASVLGTIPETLSRMLTKMAGQGLIKAEGSRILIMDREGLEELAAGLSRL